MNRWMKVAVGVAVVALSGSAGAAAAALHSTGASRPHVYRAAAVTPQLRPEALFVPLTACRVIYTPGHGILTPTQVRNFYVSGNVGFRQQGGKAGGCAVPQTATAVAINFRVLSPTAAGYLTVWPDTAREPSTATLSWIKGASLGDTSTMAIVAGPGLDLSAHVHGTSAHISADVLGYYVPQIEAEIGADGTINSGTARVVSVSHAANSGAYAITLDRPARTCSPAAVTYNVGHYASVGLSSSTTPNVISVYTWNIDGNGSTLLNDYSFFLSVTC